MRTIGSRLLAAAGLSAIACAPTPGPARSNTECGGCHATQAEAFSASPHARASETDLFRALRATGDANTRSFCDRCHAPHEAPGERGVGCVTCHTVVATRGVSDGRLVAGDDDEVTGPFADPVPTAAHRSRTSAFLRSADLCGTCHEVAGPGALIERPYTEWLGSPAREVGVTCIDCHMSAAPGEPGSTRPRGRAAIGGPERSLSSHAFVGPEHPRANELLRRAATIGLRVEVRDARSIAVDVSVTNRNGGHALPSGARFAREVWVEVSAVDARGARHVVTGGLDARGAPLADDVARIDLGDRVTRGGVAALPLVADPPEVRAVPAGGRRTWRVAVPASWEGSTTVTVAARLRYRRNAWALREALGLPPDEVAPVDLAEGSVQAGP